MDEIVKAALKKWPNVPDCYGWLALDARGDWYMRDDRTQAAGPFPQVKGSRILHEKLREFIHRNYERDEQGRWFFQNGPQRVYVELEAAPFVWRLMEGASSFSSGLGEAQGGNSTEGEDPDAGAWHGPLSITSHAGLAAQLHQAWLDEQGRLFLECDLGLGIVHTLDMNTAADAIERGLWTVREMAFAKMPEHFAYVLSPAQSARVPRT